MPDTRLVFSNGKEKRPHGTPDFPLAVHRLTPFGGSDPGTEGGQALFGPHWHAEFEFLYVEKGTIAVYTDHRCSECGAGCLVFIDSGEIHSARSAGTPSETVVYAVVFSPAFLSSDYSDAVYANYVRPVIEKKLVFPTVTSPGEPRWAGAADDMRELLSNYDFTGVYTGENTGNCTECRLRDVRGAALKLKSLMFDLWYRLAADSPTRETPEPKMSEKNREAIKASLDYIDEHLSDALTLKTLASKVYMSRGNFSRAFRRYVNDQPFHYINRLRISRSLEYLAGGMSVTECASLCGYQSVSYYNRKFVETMGCTPTEYKKKIRKGMG